MKSCIKENIDEVLIAEKHKPFGPPRDWVYKKIEKIKNKLNNEE